MRKKHLIISYEAPNGDLGELIKRKDAEADAVAKTIAGIKKDGSGFGFGQRDLEYSIPEVAAVDAIAKFAAKGFSAVVMGRR